MADDTGSAKKPLLAKYFEDAKRYWERLPKPMRTMMVLVLILAIGGAAALAVLNRTKHQVLFSGLGPEDAAAIVEHLKGNHVEYRIEGGGSVIMVPADQVHDIRLELAGQGLPVGGGVGFEIFDEQRFGMTEFEERMALQRSLEGELTRTITRLEVIKAARVHIVLAKKSLLGSQTTPAQASVVVDLVKGRELSKEMIGSIVRLISTSVDSLSPDRVTVVDTSGRLLSTEAAIGKGGQGYDYQKKFEEDIQSSVSQMLDQLLGPGASVVRVAADMDFAARESTAERYDPEKSAVRSERRETETTGSQSSGAGGIPGATSNLPGGAPPNARGNSANSKREMETRNYEIDRVVEKTVSPGATLKKISVAVLVNGVNKEGEAFEPRSAANLRKIETAVRGAVGFDKDRGDNVVVQSLPFHVPEAIDMEEMAEPFNWEEWLHLIVGGLVVIFLVLFVLALRRRKGSQEALPAGAPMNALPLPRPVHELESYMQEPGMQELPAAEAMAASLQAAQDIPTPQNDATSMLMGQVRQLFLEESEGASRVLKSWLGEAKNRAATTTEGS